MNAIQGRKEEGEERADFLARGGGVKKRKAERGGGGGMKRGREGAERAKEKVQMQFTQRPKLHSR